ncbi:MAG: magnesium chelatase domain-containing protein, partial [Alphaproteobacteria bacterium]
VLAVLEARCGLAFGTQDVYLNVAGGLRITEPAADLAVAAALISSHLDRPVASDTVVFGEIGLAGEVRAVSQTEIRLKEAAKLGFARALIPTAKEGRNQIAKRDSFKQGPPTVREIGHLLDLIDILSDRTAKASGDHHH